MIEIPLTKRLSFQQAKHTVIVALTLGLLISLVQIAYDLNNEKKQIDQTVHQILNISKSSAVQAAVNLDKALAAQVIEGLFQYEPIFDVKITDNFGDTLARQNRMHYESSMEWFTDIFFEQHKTYYVPLMHPVYMEQMGLMEVQVDIMLITINFFNRAKLIIISGILRNTALACILFILFYYYLTKPLLVIKNSLSRISNNGESQMTVPIPAIHKDNEIGQLVSEINNMITAQNSAMSELLTREKEKEVLLAEVHHRVKNNMAVISSFIQLQIRAVNDTGFRQVLRETKQRIKSMALVHEKLYRSKNFSYISTDGYTQELVKDLAHSYNKPDIEMILEVQDIHMKLDTLIPFGLIVNEIVSNSFKHAFKNVKSPLITLRLTQSDGRVQLFVSDNGSGTQPGAANPDRKPLGLDIINGLVGQLYGKIESVTDTGFQYTISFPLDGENSNESANS